ncbi:MAG: Gliding motility lipoprotein GldH [Owenweeksia sp. TMED14]|nr:MAG: Gliding motility lipoprotein GldH [Owenweeksia sp. TMED14]
MSKVKKGSILLILLLVISCGEKPVAHELRRNVNDLWWQDSVLSVDVSITDTSFLYRVSFRICHTVDYPYSNLYLFRNVLSEKRTEYQDTIEVMLNTPEGNWIGNGVGSLKTIDIPYHKNGVKFPRPGNYRFRFYHGMRDEPLVGIRDLVLTISKEAKNQ